MGKKEENRRKTEVNQKKICIYISEILQPFSLGTLTLRPQLGHYVAQQVIVRASPASPKHVIQLNCH